MKAKNFSFSSSDIVPEWREYYANYRSLSLILDSVELFDYHIQPAHPFYQLPLRPEEVWFINQQSSIFGQELISELYKVNWFFKYQFTHRVMVIVVKFQRNVQILQQLEDGAKDRRSKKSLEKFKILFKNAFKTHYKEAYHISQFQKVNLNIFSVLLSEYGRRFRALGFFDEGIPRKFRALFTRSYLSFKEAETNRALAFLKISFAQKIEKVLPSEVAAKLDQYAKGKQFTTRQTVVTALLAGAAIISLIYAFLFLWLLNFFTDNDSDFTLDVFPVFRGSLALFLYLLFLGVQVYIWEKYDINYRRVLGIQMKYSTSSEMIIRAMVFLVLWGCIFLYTLQSYFGETKSPFLSQFAASIMACSIFFVFLLYLVCPIPHLLNSSGRLWFWSIVLDIILSPIKRPTFLTVWATNQISSFPLVLRDMSYSFCYFIELFQNEKHDASIQCKSSVVFLVFDIASSQIGFLFRLAQCLNVAIRTKDPVDRKFQIINIFKISTAVHSNTWAFLMRYFSWAEFVWYGAAVLSSLSFYAWDVLRDFAVFQRGSRNRFLRDQLAYPKKWVYYLAIVLNLFFRFAWMIQMSPLSIFRTPIQKNLLSTASAIIEGFRRCMWNVFKIETEHLKLVGHFDSIQNVPWPENFNELNDFKQHKETIKEEYNSVVNKLKLEVAEPENEVESKQLPSRSTSKEPFDLNCSVEEAEILATRGAYLRKVANLDRKILIDLKLLGPRPLLEAAEVDNVDSGLRRVNNFKLKSYPELMREQNLEDSIEFENETRPDPLAVPGSSSAHLDPRINKQIPNRESPVVGLSDSLTNEKATFLPLREKVPVSIPNLNLPHGHHDVSIAPTSRPEVEEPPSRASFHSQNLPIELATNPVFARKLTMPSVVNLPHYENCAITYGQHRPEPSDEIQKELNDLQIELKRKTSFSFLLPLPSQISE